MQVNYKFYINGSQVYPDYSADFSMESAMETDQRFFRTKPTSDLIFKGRDYDTLDASAFDTEFAVLIETYLDGVHDASQDWEGKFYKTDGTWDEDNKRVSVKPTVVDQYTAILAGMQKEYDLIREATARTPLNLDRRPVLQFYKPDDDVVTNIVGGTFWEQPVSEPKSRADMADYYFGEVTTTRHMKVEASGGASPTPSDVVGGYIMVTGNFGQPETWEFVQDNNGLYTMEVVRQGAGTPEDPYEYAYEIIRKSDSEVLFRSQYSTITAPTVALFTSVSSESSGTLSGLLDDAPNYVYARWALNEDTLNGNTTNDIPTDDFTQLGGNYQKVISLTVSDSPNVNNNPPVMADSIGSTEPTVYGLRTDNKYYTPPYTDKLYIPLSRNTWDIQSLWLNYRDYLATTEASARTQYQTKDCFFLSDVIAKLLGLIGSTATHYTSTDYSEFLYSTTNPVSGEVGPNRIILAPKSNITEGSYDQPAQKSPILFSDIDRVLKALELYWFVDDQGRLRIEHISWFKNGGSYSGVQQIGTDLTTEKEPRTKKPWGYESSKFKYNKVDMSERLEFSWMDTSTKMFEGDPIQVQSNYVEEGSVEDVEASKFTSDVDYMLISPEEVSKDGFALFWAYTGGTTPVLPYKDLDLQGKEAVLQNGLLSFVYIQPNFWVNDLPAKNVEINGEAVVASGIRRTKTQTVKFPSADAVDATKLIKTYLGNGEIKKITLNLSSRMNTVELAYDPE